MVKNLVSFFSNLKGPGASDKKSLLFDGLGYPPDGQKGPAKHQVKMGTLTVSTRQSKACYCHAANAHTPNALP